MIKLQDRIQIRTKPELLFRWLESMPREYGTWHPDHVACRVLTGSMLEVGSVIHCEEVLHGKLHVMRLRPTSVEAGKRIEYEIERLGKGIFRVIPKGEQVEFVAELHLGTEIPLVGPLVDIVLRSFLRRRLDILRQHMREEGQNLKQIIESGWEPRTSLDDS